MTEHELIPLLQQAWCKETSADPDNWTILRPSYGQCAVTAIVVSDILDLPVVRGWAIVNDARISHYWNRDLDLTAGQFPDTARFEERDGVQGQAAYAYILSNPETAQRAQLLRDRLAALAAGHDKDSL